MPPILVRQRRLHFFGGLAGVLAWAVNGGGVLRSAESSITIEVA
jgi:hypothetical protein